MGRRIRYSVAMSLDGFIADGDGGYDWITEEPGIDFEAFLAKVDTLLMGRATYETALGAPGGLDAFSHLEIHVVSTTLDPVEHPDVHVIGSDVTRRVRELKQQGASPRDASAEPTAVATPRDIWLFGGGILFRSLLEAELVDRVEVAVVPVLLGEGIPVLPGLAADFGGEDRSDGGPGVKEATETPPTSRPRVPMALHSSETFPSGMLLLKYDVGGR